jgi:hypothetical protein
MVVSIEGTSLLPFGTFGNSPLETFSVDPVLSGFKKLLRSRLLGIVQDFIDPVCRP